MVADMPADYAYEMQMPPEAFQECVQEADAGKLSFNNNEITIPEIGVIQINMEELHNANNKIMKSVQEKMNDSQEKMSDEDFDHLADFMDIMNGYCHNTKEFRDYNSAIQKIAEDKITGNEASLNDDLQNYYQKKDAYLEVEQKAMKDFTKELDNYPLYDNDNVLSKFKMMVLDMRHNVIDGGLSEERLEKIKNEPQAVQNINAIYGSYLACNDDDNITLDDNGMPEITENNVKRLMAWYYDNQLATVNDGMEDRAFIKENAKKLMDLEKDEHLSKVHDDYLFNKAAYDILSTSFNKYFDDEQKGFDTLRMFSSEMNLARYDYTKLFNQHMNTEATNADIENSVLDNSYTESNYKNFLNEHTSVPVNNNEFIRVQKQPEMKEMVQGVIAVLSDKTLENDQNLHIVKADEIFSYADEEKDKDGKVVAEKDVFKIYHNNDTKTMYVFAHGAMDGTYERQPDDDTSKLVEDIIKQYKDISKGKSKLNDDNVDNIVLISCYPGLHKAGYNKEFNADVKLISGVDIPLAFAENVGKDGYFGWRAVNKTDAELYKNALTPEKSKILETKDNRKEMYQRYAQYYHNVYSR